MVEKVVSEAKKWLGYLEKKNSANLEDYTKNAGYNNYTIFAKKYLEYFGINLQGQPWCAMFVSCVFREALGKTEQLKIMPNFSYCPYGVQNFKILKRWYTSNPQKGDVVFFKDSTNVACHVGVVYNVDTNYIYTIEGNTSATSGVIANGGGVFAKKYNKGYSKILGYGRPNYTELVVEKTIPWQQAFLDNMVNKGYITDRAFWSCYDCGVTKSYCIALLDKITGGKWISEDSNSNIHWAQPHIISLQGKGVITNYDEWVSTLNQSISKALFLALIDKATGGMKEIYQNQKYDHWARANLNSLCDKEIISTPEAWYNDFEAELTRGNCMALLCKAFNI